jgi:rhodanese-related sulfurtransferase
LLEREASAAASARTIDELLAASRSRIRRYSPGEALEAQHAGATIVDTRCREALDAVGAIPGSVHIPLSVLFWRLDPTSGHAIEQVADRERQMILVCADGYSSSIAAVTLVDLGFSQVGDLDGGFSGWLAAGLPVGEISIADSASGEVDALEG